MDAAILFDLDGTLVDSVYQHVLAWKEALDHEGIGLSVWRIHRRIGMSGGLFTNMLLREVGGEISPDRIDRLRRLHAEAYRSQAAKVHPLPGARELLRCLADTGVPHAIATSGRMETARVNLEALQIDLTRVPVVTRDQVKYAKPDPDLFITAASRLNVPIEASLVVGDAIWDMLAARRARAFGIGLLSGGYGQEELERAGAARVYEDPAHLLRHLDEVGIRRRSSARKCELDLAMGRPISGTRRMAPAIPLRDVSPPNLAAPLGTPPFCWHIARWSAGQ